LSLISEKCFTATKSKVHSFKTSFHEAASLGFWNDIIFGVVETFKSLNIDNRLYLLQHEHNICIDSSGYAL